MNSEVLYRLNKLRRKYFLLRLTEIVLLSSGVFFLIHSLSGTVISGTATIKFFLSFSAGLISFIALFFYYRLNRINHNSFARFLNGNFPPLRESADLMLQDEGELTGLQKIQQRKTLEQFKVVFPSIKLPHHVTRSSVAFVICFSIYLLSSSFLHAVKKTRKEPTTPSQAITAPDPETATYIQSVSVAISPPAYTGLVPFSTTNFDLHFPEGSEVRWSIEFSGRPENASIHFSGKDSINMGGAKNSVAVTRIVESGFYQLQWSDKAKTNRSDYFKLEVIKDQPPKIEIKNLQQFTRLKYHDLQPFDLRAALTDDYGLTEALIVATVSKGSGEAVKFREEKLRFTSPQKITGKHLVASRSLDLKKLGLDPGDELYFYVEAWDNKSPLPNHHRTETYFMAVLDTATEITSVDSGLGVDLMPEYFRSQRQIIIDTEKLLRDKKRISSFEFKSTSNELGYDQKVLRLRYGQFLGEEDEGGIGQEATGHQEDEEQDVTKQYGHLHDTKNEHNLVEAKKGTPHQQGEVKSPEEKEDPIKAFAHNHDNTEVATFFIQSLKAKLKAAVTIMWDAELYLRLYEPEKSLPYQYKALNLLKEISNDSRVYVHRTGFDPPPLKEDKRLTADLSEVKTNSNQTKARMEKDHPSIRQALNRIEKMIVENAKIVSESDRIVFRKAGQELSAEALKAPLRFLKPLSLLKSLSDQQVRTDQMTAVLGQLRKSFWSLLVHQPPSPVRQARQSTPLDQEFIESFEQIRNE